MKMPVGKHSCFSFHRFSTTPTVCFEMDLFLSFFLKRIHPHRFNEIDLIRLLRPFLTAFELIRQLEPSSALAAHCVRITLDKKKLVSPGKKKEINNNPEIYIRHLPESYKSYVSFILAVRRS